MKKQLLLSLTFAISIGVIAQSTYKTIGKTYYDKQTNSSVCNSIVVDDDGSVSATWTMTHDVAPSTSTSRGTGYNYFNPGTTSWNFTNPADRLESARTGWPNVGVTKNKAEIIISHEAVSGGTGELYVLRRATKGTGAWTETKMGITDTWPRMVVGGTNGNTIHVISQTTGAAPPKQPFNGQDGAIRYSRSTDGGATWEAPRVITEINSAVYLGFGADNYAIDAMGDTVVILLGGKEVDVVMLKSTNNGVSWTKTIIKKFPIPKYSGKTATTDTLPKDNIPDTLDTNDGSLAVLLDKQGKAHVWYGRTVVVCSTPGTGTGLGLGWDEASSGLMYWNENMIGKEKPFAIAFIQNIDGDNKISIKTWGKYAVCLTSMPSAGIDAQGRIFVSYAGAYEGITDGGNPPGVAKSFRHTYVMRSDDGGATWCAPLDIDDKDATGTGSETREGVYASMAKKVTDHVHLVYQVDQTPGHGLGEAPNTEPQRAESEIVYVKIPVNLVCTVGINENNKAAANVSIYPNPANTSVTLSFEVTHASKVSVVIYNVMGQKRDEVFNQINTVGTHQVTINTSNYKQGIYFVNGSIDGKMFSKKLVIE